MERRNSGIPDNLAAVLGLALAASVLGGTAPKPTKWDYFWRFMKNLGIILAILGVAVLAIIGAVQLIQHWPWFLFGLIILIVVLGVTWLITEG